MGTQTLHVDSVRLARGAKHYSDNIFNISPATTPEYPTILHQPLVSRFRVIFPLLGQILNGISVSGPPKIGERPYPRQFHPVEFSLFLTRNCQFYIPPHELRPVFYHNYPQSTLLYARPHINITTRNLYQTHLYIKYP